MKKTILLTCFLVTVTLAQPGRALAQRVFRSTQSANLPTAAMLNGGNWLFEVSHRFDTPISRGAGALWGLDGPVLNRLGLTYAAHDRLMLTVLRTNGDDNVELNAKFRVVETGSDAMPVEVAALGGIAWNTEVSPRQGATDNEMQAYVQLIVNALLGDRVALGAVPTFLYNDHILDVDTEIAFVLGLHAEVYTSGALSFLGEWNISEAREGFDNDGGTFGIELRTRGHFFKIVLTNQSFMNPTQFLAGTHNDFTPDEWRFGFNLTRLLPF